jgi:hypothetical protein
MGFIKHIHNAIDQFNELESQVPLLKEKYGFSSPNSDIIKLIVSFEPLLGLKEGPIRDWVEEEKKKDGLKMNWIVIWVGELEEAQPYISKGANFWSFLKDYWEKDFNSILMEMKSKTGASYKEGILYQYEEMMFKELLKNAPSSEAQSSLLNS